MAEEEERQNMLATPTTDAERLVAMITNLLNEPSDNTRNPPLDYRNITHIPSGVAGASELFAALRTVEAQSKLFAFSPNTADKVTAERQLREAAKLLQRAEPVLEALAQEQFGLALKALTAEQQDQAALVQHMQQRGSITDTGELDLRHIESDSRDIRHHYNLSKAHGKAKPLVAAIAQAIDQALGKGPQRLA